jgi:hypothetical protein
MNAKSKFCLKLAAVLFAILAGAANLRADLYDTQVRRTAIVVTPDGGRGTAFVIDKRLHLVVTNYHVASGTGAYRIFWHLHKSNGESWNHSEYLGDFYRLHDEQLAGFGYVVAQRADKDLSILYVDYIPDWVEEVPFATSTPDPGDVIHFVGHPGGRNPYIYSIGQVTYVGHSSWRYASDGQSIDAEVVHFRTQAYFGFSGSAVVNSAGELVGILTGSSTTAATAIGVSELRWLFGTVRNTRVFSIANRTNGTVKFYIRNNSSEEWKFNELSPGQSWIWWNGNDDFAPQVMFDWTYSPDFDEVRYNLDADLALVGDGGTPEHWAHGYVFRQVRGGLDLFES